MPRWEASSAFSPAARARNDDDRDRVEAHLPRELLRALELDPRERDVLRREPDLHFLPARLLLDARALVEHGEDFVEVLLVLGDHDRGATVLEEIPHLAR